MRILGARSLAFHYHFDIESTGGKQPREFPPQLTVLYNPQHKQAQRLSDQEIIKKSSFSLTKAAAVASSTLLLICPGERILLKQFIPSLPHFHLRATLRK